MRATDRAGVPATLCDALGSSQGEEPQGGDRQGRHGAELSEVRREREGGGEGVWKKEGNSESRRDS